MKSRSLGDRVEEQDRRRAQRRAAASPEEQEWFRDLGVDALRGEELFLYVTGGASFQLPAVACQNCAEWVYTSPSATRDRWSRRHRRCASFRFLEESEIPDHYTPLASPLELLANAGRKA